MKSLSRAVLAIAVAIVPFASAHADTFTESVQFGPGLTDYAHSSGVTAGPGGSQLYYFDSNGGTLNAITFSYGYSLSSAITITNTGSASSSGSVRTQSAAQFSSNSSAINAALNAAVNNYVDPVDGTGISFGSSTLSPIAADVRGNTSTYMLSPGASTSFSSTGSYNSSAYTITNASVLSAFSKAGGGTFTPLFGTLTGLILTNNGGNSFASQVTTAQGNLVISFNYSAATATPMPAVPEPASWAMMIAGLGAIGIALRRRSSARTAMA